MCFRGFFFEGLEMFLYVESYSEILNFVRDYRGCYIKCVGCIYFFIFWYRWINNGCMDLKCFFIRFLKNGFLILFLLFSVLFLEKGYIVECCVIEGSLIYWGGV